MKRHGIFKKCEVLSGFCLWCTCMWTGVEWRCAKKESSESEEMLNHVGKIL